MLCLVQVDGLVRAELQAHSRLLAAMAVHPTRNMFATAAEDATLAVWMLSEDLSQASSGCFGTALHMAHALGNKPTP